MIEIVPAIDLIDGKCVRLRMGDYSQKKEYAYNPLELAKEFEAAGIRRLHMVDLDGALEKRIVNWRILEQVCRNTSLSVDYGGGITSRADIELVFNAGASYVVIGSLAVKQQELVLTWLKEIGPGKIIIGADVKDGQISINAWKDISSQNLNDFIGFYMAHGANHFLCTDIEKDGLMLGSSLDLYKKVVERFPGIKLIASGGVSSVYEINMLQECGVHAAIIGKAFYEGKLQLSDFSNFL